MNKVPPKAYSLIPGPKFPESLPFVGCKDILTGGKESFPVYVKEYYDRFGSICKIKLLGKDIVLLTSAEGFKTMFDACRPYPDLGPVSTNMQYYKRIYRPELFRDSLGLVINGPEWAKVRSIMNPIMMQPSSAVKYLDEMTEISKELVDLCDDILDKDDKLPSNFSSYLQQWAMENAGAVLLDHRFNCLKSGDAGTEGEIMVRNASAMSLLTMTLGDASFIWGNLKLGKIWPDWKKFDTLFLEYKAIIDKQVERTKKRIRDGETGDRNVGILEQAYMKTGIDSGIPAGFVHDAMRGAVETTSNSAGFLMYHLASNPRCQEELVRRMKDKTYEQNLKELTGPRSGYLYACLRESQRILPPTFGTVRIPDKDVEVEGFIIPAGTQVLLCIQNMGMGAFQRPTEFIPERWLVDESNDSGDKFDDIAKEHHPLALPTFGHGPRMCIGMRVARLEIFVLLLQMLSTYKLGWDGEEMGIKSHGINNPSLPLTFTLEKRK